MRQNYADTFESWDRMAAARIDRRREYKKARDIEAKRLLSKVADAFRGWQDEIANGLQSFGFDAEQARSLAITALSQLEGALLLARAYRSLDPLRWAEESIRILVRGFHDG